MDLDVMCVSSVPSSPSEGGRGKAGGTQQVQAHLKEILAKYSNGFWASKLPHTYRELYQQELPPGALQDLEAWTHVCTVRPPLWCCVEE